MKNLVWVLLLVSASVSGVEDNEPNKGEQNRDCKVTTVTNETSNTRHVITTCIERVSVGELVRSVETESTKPSAHQNSNDDWQRVHSAADLVAQQDMASATKRIRDYTFAGVVIGVIGLFFLWRTVRHSQTASLYALQALDTARDELRCNVGLSPAPRSHEMYDDWPIDFEIFVTASNQGKTEAVNCTYRLGEARINGQIEISSFSDPEDIETGRINPDKNNSGSRIIVPVTLSSIEDTSCIAIRLAFVDKYRECFVEDYVGRVWVQNNFGESGFVAMMSLKHTGFQKVNYLGVPSPETETSAMKKKQRKS